MKSVKPNILARLMARLVQTSVGLDQHDDPKAFEQNDHAVEQVMPLLLYLRLAHKDEGSPIGYVPTNRFVDLVVDRVGQGRKPKAPRWTKKSDHVLKRLGDAVWGEWAKKNADGRALSEWERQLSAEWAGFRVLAALNVLWTNEWQEVRARPILYELLDESGHGDILVPPSGRRNKATSEPHNHFT